MPRRKVWRARIFSARGKPKLNGRRTFTARASLGYTYPALLAYRPPPFPPLVPLLFLISSPFLFFPFPKARAWFRGGHALVSASRAVRLVHKSRNTTVLREEKLHFSPLIPMRISGSNSSRCSRDSCAE